MKVLQSIVVAGSLVAALFLPGECLAAHTQVSLLADSHAIIPGKPFTVGLLLRMDPAWHTYWKNPGDAGLATEIKWKLPPGFVAGPIAWPLPQKSIEEGDVLTYGYSGQTMLLVPITPPSGIPTGTTLKLAADVSWLECKSTCVPGAASVQLELPVAAAAAPDHRDLFDAYEALVPPPHTAADGLKVRASASAKTITFDVDFPSVPAAGTVDFYPDAIPNAQVSRPSIRLSHSSANIALSVSSFEKIDSAVHFHGVLVFASPAGVKKGIDLLTELPATFFSSTEGGANGSAGKGILDQQFATVSPGSQGSLLVYLLLALVGGLLLNIMPCVLPVIALKIFGLVKMAGDNPRRVRKLGWTFSSGILFSFVVLALFVIILQAAGQRVGWGFQFQEPLFVVVMATIVFAFGLSLFGVFEIRLPARALEGVGSVLQKHEGETGYAPSFFEGVFATILATPCTAPFLGTALGFAFAQPWWGILLIFATVAVGMALPYIVLTSKPAWMKFLPKPGAWMETAKQFMGFLMMATLLWLLYILGKQLGMEAVVWTGAFLLTVGFACWMIGRFLTLSSSRTRAIVVWLIAAVVVVGGWWGAMGDVMSARDVLEAGVSAVPASSGGEGISWEGFDKSRLESLLDANTPVLIDFTAEWCLTCKVNEKTVLSDPEVIAKIKESGIVPIRADWTNRNPEITRLLSKFGRSGVPLYVVFPQGKPTEPIVLPEVITKSILLEAVEKSVRPVVAAESRQR